MAPAQAAGVGGGAVYVAKPEVSKVTCLRACASRGRAQGGSTLKIRGRSLGQAARVVFHGGIRGTDDTEVRIRPGSETRLHARVPVGAVSGPVSVVTGAGVSSARTRTIAITRSSPPRRALRSSRQARAGPRPSSARAVRWPSHTAWRLP
jgi:hypothetical protein